MLVARRYNVIDGVKQMIKEILFYLIKNIRHLK